MVVASCFMSVRLRVTIVSSAFQICCRSANSSAVTNYVLVLVGWFIDAIMKEFVKYQQMKYRGRVSVQQIYMLNKSPMKKYNFIFMTYTGRSSSSSKNLSTLVLWGRTIVHIIIFVSVLLAYFYTFWFDKISAECYIWS